MEPLRRTSGMWCEGTYLFKYVTDRAILIEDDGKDIWIPKSQNTEDSAPYNNGEEMVVDICIPEWLAKEKDMI